MKKIMILIAGILFSATTAMAVVKTTGMATVDSNGNANLMEELDTLMDEVKTKENKVGDTMICTLEYEPICGQQDENLITYGNKCQFNYAKKQNPNLVFLYVGECKNKNVKKKFDPTKLKIPFDDKKITKEKKGFDCPLNMINPVPCEKEGGKLVAGKKDENGCVLEWKCVKKNYNTGITGGINGINNKVPAPEIKIDLKEDIEKEPKNWRGDDKVFLGKGLEVISDNGDEMDKKLSLEFNGEKIKIDDNLLLQEKDGDILLEGKKIFSTDILKVREKAKKVVGAEKVLEIKFEQENNKPIYVIKTKKKTKFLGLFDFDMEAEVKIDVDTGEVLEVDEPWYSFLLF